MLLSWDLRKQFICIFAEEYMYLFKFSCVHLIDWAKIPNFLCTVTWINFSWCVSWPSWFTEASLSIFIYIFSEYITVNFKILCLCISLRSTKSKLQSTLKCLCCVETIQMSLIMIWMFCFFKLYLKIWDEQLLSAYYCSALG